MILTVLSASPTARNRDLCSPEGTLARAMHTTSADMSFRSVYSFNWPAWKIGMEWNGMELKLQNTNNAGQETL